MQHKILQARRDLGLSQDKFAAELGVSRRSIQWWESGRSEPHASNLRKLTLVTGKPVAWFLEEDQEEVAV